MAGLRYDHFLFSSFTSHVYNKSKSNSDFRTVYKKKLRERDRAQLILCYIYRSSYHSIFTPSMDGIHPIKSSCSAVMFIFCLHQLPSNPLTGVGENDAVIEQKTTTNHGV